MSEVNDDTTPVEPDFSARQAVDLALNGKPVDFADYVNTLLASRLQDAVDYKREEVAQSLFGEPEAEQDDAPPAEEDNTPEDDDDTQPEDE